MRPTFNLFGAFTQDVFAEVRFLADTAPGPVKPVLQYQLKGLERSKGYRIAFLYASAQCASSGLTYHELVGRAAVLHLFHESCLLFDDIFDRSRYRRGQIAAHCKFGRVPAICTAVWAKDVGLARYKESSALIEAICQCTTALIDAEAFQWAARKLERPTKFEDWFRIAKGSTGALFRLAAKLGGLSTHDHVIDAISIGYHGIDDVHDLLEISGIGGGGADDLRDNIPTLPSCFTDGTSQGELQKTVPLCISFLEQQLTVKLSGSGRIFEPFFDEMRLLLAMATPSQDKDSNGEKMTNTRSAHYNATTSGLGVLSEDN